MKPVGIAIVTYNRLPRLRELVAKIRALTTSPYELVVAEDGGSDGAADWCRNEGVRVVTGENRGVCWNKNRGLYALAALGCDPLLLLEDDSLPIEAGWEDHWRRATALWGHVSFAHPKLADQNLSGDGSAEDPYVNHKPTAQCASISAEGLGRLGYFDTRFQGYGVGHAEWTARGKRLGFGFKPAPLPDGRTGQANLYIHGGLRSDDAPSFRDNEAVMQNRALFEVIKNEPPYRAPWADGRERETFLAEIAAAGLPVDASPGDARLPSTGATAAPARKLDPQGLARVREDLKKRLPAYRVRSYVEVGAHLGESVHAARYLFPDADVHAFEPVPEIFAALIAAWGDDPKVRPHQLALGRTAGALTMRTKGTSPGAHVVPKAVGPRFLDVPATTGDLFMAEAHLKRISLLRVDTEGHELEVLAGFQQALANSAVDLVDVTAGLSGDNRRHVPFERLKAYLEPMGYQLFSIRNQAHDRGVHLRRCSLVFVSRPVSVGER